MVLLASNDDLSFARNEADLALRLSRPTADASLRMLRFALVASPARLAGEQRLAG